MGTFLKTSAATMTLAASLPLAVLASASATAAPSAPTSAAGGTAVTRVAPTGTYMIECVDDQLRERSRKFVLTCADGNEYLDKLTWKGWGKNGARAVGVVTVQPTYAEKKAGQKTRSYPVKVVADRLVKREANQVYTRLKVTFTGKKAPGEPRTMVVRLPH